MGGFPQSTTDQLRHSHGLEQFFEGLRNPPGQQVLDLGQFTQANVAYITGLGHRLYTEDVQHTLDLIFGPGDPLRTQADPAKSRQFLDQVLQFPPEHFDAILVWDALERLSRPLLDVVMERLWLVLRPNATLLAWFNAESREDTVPDYSFRIAGPGSLQVLPKGRRRTVHSFNNRSIERLFQQFNSLKFFLTRDHLREIIAKR